MEQEEKEESFGYVRKCEIRNDQREERTERNRKSLREGKQKKIGKLDGAANLGGKLRKSQISAEKFK